MGGEFIDNSADNAGGGLWVSTSLSISGTDFISNTAGESSGGLAVIHASATVVDATFERNRALSKNGGGLGSETVP